MGRRVLGCSVLRGSDGVSGRVMCVEERFPVEAASVPLARRLVEAFRPQMGAEAFGLLRLVVSELVANCVQHSRGRGTVAVEAARSDLHVHVAVRCPKGVSAPQVVSPGSRGGGGGLGLAIVDAVAADWGIGEDGSCSLVWADIAIGEPESPPGN